MATLTTSSRIRNRIKASERYAERDDAGLLMLHQNGSLSAGKIVKVGDQVGIISKILFQKGGKK